MARSGAASGRPLHMKAWEYEHGPEFEVPDSISKLEGIEDQSWHNDISPSFGKTVDWGEDQADVRLWVDHPDPTKREYGENYPRFSVNVFTNDSDLLEQVRTPPEGRDAQHLWAGDLDDQHVWSGDDEHEAGQMFMKTLTTAQMHAHRKRKKSNMSGDQFGG